MVRIKPNWGTWWPDDATHLEASDVIGMYKQGFVGAFQDPEAKERLDDHIRSMGDDPDGGNVAHRYGFTESGAGKLTLLFPAVTKFYGYEALSKPAQGTGDCKEPHSPVVMADGSEKRIADIAVGEEVLSANRIARKVTRTIKKPYTGRMVRVKASGVDRSTSATPDHQFWAHRNRNGQLGSREWIPIADLHEGDAIYMPCLEDGRPSVIESVTNEGTDGYVYCLEVDQDASFISDGYAVHNCVSMAGRDVSLYLVCVDALSGTPDEETGRVEDVPQVSETARNNGVFCNEGIYLHRGHNGQGMSCDQGLEWIMRVGGVVPRMKYPQANLESYNVNFELRGSAGSPDWLDEVGKKHQVRKATRPQTHEQARDYLAIGCPIWTCSSLGFSDVRDANGYSRRSGSWAHSWHVCGYDDRPWTRQAYGFPLALFGHRWGTWNSGPRRIKDTNIDIPNGYAWIDARLLNQCWMAAVNSVNGWPKRNLPDYGFSVLG